MKIPVLNNFDQDAQFSYISNGEDSGASSLRVKNTNPFHPSWAIQLGKTGEAQAEVLMLSASAISGTSVSLTGTARYEHPADTPVYAIKYDQIVFMRSTSGTAGTATAMTDGTLTITPNSEYTELDDTTGASTYAYKAKLRNSVSGVESEESDWITPTGHNWYSLGKLRERVLVKAEKRGISADPDFVDDSINALLEKMNQAAIAVNQDYSLGTVAVAFGTSGLGTITSSDFIFATEAWISYDGVNSYKATKQMANTALPNQTYTTSHPYINWQGDTVFKVMPSDTAGTATFEHQKLFTRLITDGDELPLYMRNHTEAFIDYAYGQVLKQDQSTERLGAEEEKKGLAAVGAFQVQITPRLKTGQTFIEYVEPISGDDYY